MARRGAPEVIAIIRWGTIAVSVRNPDQVVLFEPSTPA